MIIINITEIYNNKDGKVINVTDPYTFNDYDDERLKDMMNERQINMIGEQFNLMEIDGEDSDGYDSEKTIRPKRKYTKKVKNVHMIEKTSFSD